MKVFGWMSMFFVLLAVGGCVTKSASDHASQLHSESDRQMTVGTVQKEIRKGMTGGEVASVLGSPNIVSKDRENSQTWIYDKIASEVSYSHSSSSGGILGMLIGFPEAKRSGATASTQKTLTVVIKFTEGRVSEFSYHSSKF